MKMSVSSENILQHMAVPSKPNVYQIGCLESRVTLYSQQVRALNLAFALFERRKLARDSRVAVIGGGAAGMTATAALAQCGASVTLLERLDAVIPFQSGSLTRWLHPHIYEWPADGCRNVNADLPLLDWSANYAANVAIELRDEFYRLVRKLGTIKVQIGVRNVGIQAGQVGQRLEWRNAGGGFHSERFDVIVLAVGFGLERPGVGAAHSYWRNDDLAQYEIDADRIRHHLVSGCGDGGLVDLLRIRIRDFRHDQVLEEFLGGIPTRSLEKELLRVEEVARDKAERGEDPADFLYDEYQRLRPLHIDEMVASRLRRDTRATLNGPSQFPWRLNASILNRFLASALIGLRNGEAEFTMPSAVGADWWRGEIACVSQAEGGYRVQLKSGESRLFDRVVIRHGPVSALSTWVPPTDLEGIRSRNLLDQTRAPLWPQGFFGDRVTHQSVEHLLERSVQIFIPAHEGRAAYRVELEIRSLATFQELVNMVYFKIEPPVEPFTYGETWRLRNTVSGEVLMHARELDSKRSFFRRGLAMDSRTLEEVGILPGDNLEVIFLEHDSREFFR
ncbi:FAD-dependent oxidoreductase [Corallococcus terminator]